MAMDGAENRFENPLYAVVEARKVELSVPSTEPLPDNTELIIQQQPIHNPMGENYSYLFTLKSILRKS